MFRFASLLKSAAAHGAAPFCEEFRDDVINRYSFADWMEATNEGAAAVADLCGTGQPVGVLATRSWAAYVALGAIWRSGNHAVPLNPASPPARLNALATATRIGFAISPIGAASGQPLANMRSVTSTSAFSIHALQPSTVAVPNSDLAYVIGSSGSTGRPKVIPIGWSQVGAYCERTIPIYPFAQGTRFSQTFDLSFDPAIGDLLRALTWGGCLCPPTPLETLDLASYLRRSRVEALFTVPGVAKVSRQIEPIEANAFPWLRHISFIGERLSAELARTWQMASPNALVVNDYGPAECTVAVATAIFDAKRPGEVPIGQLSPGHDYKLREGELLIHGPQVFAGYPDSSAAEFALIEDKKYFCTGDLVSQSEDGALIFKGRRDFQFKLGGYRVDPAELEAPFLALAGVDACLALPWPRDEEDSPLGITVLIHGDPEPKAARETWQRAREDLPKLLLPKNVLRAKMWPVNRHGKVDRQVLLRWLENDREQFDDLLAPGR